MAPPTRTSPLTIAAARLASELASRLTAAALLVRLLLWDLALTLWNLLAPRRAADRVVLEGRPGAGGLWPKYVPPGKTDSRSCCPMINAMANHGILPRDGRGVTFRELAARTEETFNMAASFSCFVPYHAATGLARDYRTGTFDLADLNAHNCIEHDASLCREDAYLGGDQSKPAPDLIKALLASASGPEGTLTIGDVSRMLGTRRAECKRRNRQYSQGLSQKIFAAANASMLLTVCGGRVQDLYSFLLEERIPDGWQPRVRSARGLTFLTTQTVVLPIELGVEEEVREVLAWLHAGGARSD